MNTGGPASGQQYRGLPWFVSSIQKTLSSCANSTLLRASRARAAKLPSKFRHNAAPAIKHTRIPPKCSSCPILFSLLPTQNCQLVTRFAPSKSKVLSSLLCNFTRRISKASTRKFREVDLSAFLQSCQFPSVLPLFLHRLLFLIPYFYLFLQM